MFNLRKKSEAERREDEPSGNTEWWRVGYGNYRAYSMLDMTLSGNQKEIEQSHQNVEEFISLSIQHHLEKRRQKIKETNQTQPPVIIMDFGSTQAHSMVRLAQQYDRQIKAGELILVCTNLKHQPDEKAELEYFDGYEGTSVGELNKKTLPDYYTLAKNIRWLNGRVHEIAQQSVTDFKGNSWPLLGHVDLIHEHFVLQHVRSDEESPGMSADGKEKNAIQILDLLLSSDGLLVSTDISDKYAQPIPGSEIANSKKYRFKGEGKYAIAEYLRTIKSELLPSINDNIERYMREIEEGVLPKGFDADDLPSINKSRNKYVAQLIAFRDQLRSL